MILYIVTAVIVLSIWILTKRRNGPRIPGPRGLPLVGNTFAVKMETFHYKLEEWANKYGPIFKCNIFGIDIVVLSKPDLVRKAFCDSKTGRIFSDRAPSFLGKYVFLDYRTIVFGRNNERTFKLRKILHTGLHMYGDGVEAFESCVHQELERFTDNIVSTCGQDFDLRPVLQRSIGNIMTMLLCGEPMSDKDEDIVWNYVYAINKCMVPAYELYMYNAPFLRFTPGYFGNIYRDIILRMEELTKRYFTTYKISYQPGTERGIVDVFLRLQAEDAATDGTTWFTDDQIEGLVQAMVGGGLMTTSNTLISALLLLLQYPECLTKMYEEVMTVVGADRLPMLSDKPHMPYTEAVIIECQRMTNVVPLGMPHSCSQDTVFEGYEIKKNTRIVTNLWTINQDREIWEEPDKFCPERFLDVDGNLLPPEHKLRQSFLLFGVGRRNCPGEILARSRMFLYMSTLVQKFQILPPDTEPLASADPRTYISAGVLMPPRYKLRAVRRENQ